MSYTPSPSPSPTPLTSDSECEESGNSAIQRFSSVQGAALTPSHPFAASTKADRAPPNYEKKPSTPPTTPPYYRKHSTRVLELRAEMPLPSIQRSPSLDDDEKKRWDTAIASAIDKAETTLDLSNAGLTYIPSSIIDLKALVVLAHNERHTTSAPTATTSTRAFIRSTTAPVLLPSSRVRPFLPSRTMHGFAFKAAGKQQKSLATDRDRCEVQLYLMRNAIRMLPRELFALDCLVVLSLRQNKLTSLPPAICKLSRLRELNIANNRLSYLPAEIQDLCLDSLHLYPNPFIAPPPVPESPDNQQTHIMNSDTATRILGPLKRGPSVPTLSELALRRLLSPAIPASHIHPAARSESCLEAAMTLADIDALHLPLHINRIVRASTGHGRARVSEEGACMDAELDMSRNVCPSPRHYLRAGSGIGATKSVRFVQTVLPSTKGTFGLNGPVFAVPVEERMEWVGIVAGVQVAENPGAWVPLLWRGCGSGCLDFLENKEDAKSDSKYDHTFKYGKVVGDEEFEFSDVE